MLDSYTAQIYQDEAGEWRWRVRAANSKVVAISGEGYQNKSHAIEMVESLFPKMTVRYPEQQS